MRRTAYVARVAPLVVVALFVAATALSGRPAPGGTASAASPAGLADGASFVQPALAAGFIRSLDTMKESYDLQRSRRLSDEEIAHTVAMTATLNVRHVAVGTSWEHADYLERWVRAIRQAGLQVWFRGQPERWIEPGSAAPMTPAEYLDALRRFLHGNAHLLVDGDIFDPGLEPENGAYWSATWGPRWGWEPAFPNDATRAFNAFVRDSQVLARSLLTEVGRPGVITAVRSMNEWFATHPGALEHETVAVLGAITLDSYPDADATDPAEAARLRVEELRAIWRIWGRPIVLGELGYPLRATVSDEVQRDALAATLEGIARLPFVIGMNYWVGVPNARTGNHTALFRGQRGAWQPAVPALTLAGFYARPPQRTSEAVTPQPWRYGPNLLADSSLERGDRWFMDDAIARTPDAALSGEAGLRLPGLGTWANAAQEVALLRDTCYVVSATVRGRGGGRLDVLDLEWKPLAVSQLFGGPEWRRVTLAFASRGQRSVVLALRDSERSGELDVDDVELRSCPGPAIE